VTAGAQSLNEASVAARTATIDVAGVDLVADPATRAPAAEAAERVMYAALANGLAFKTSMGNVLVLSPPLTITAAEMHAALDILQAAIDDAARGA